MYKHTCILAILIASLGILGSLRCGGGGSSSPSTGSTASPPGIITQPASQTVTAPAAATFTVVAQGTAVTYQWNLNGTAIAGATSAAYTTPATTAAMDGSQYTVTVSGSGAPATSSPATLTVDYPSTIASQGQPQSETVTAPAPATFSVSAQSEPPAQYQWYRNGVLISGATSASYTTPATGPGNNGDNYTVTVDDGIGSPVTSAPAILTVDSAPAVAALANQNVVFGGALSLTASATGNPNAFTYLWYHNGTPTSVTSATYAVASVAATDGGTYYVAVTNSVGTTPSNTVTVATAQAATVTGQVTLLSGGAPLQGVQLSLNTSPAMTATTNASGNYSIPGVFPGSFTVTPAITGVSSAFYPATQSVTLAAGGNGTASFNAALGYTVTGTVNYAGTRTGTIFLTLSSQNSPTSLGTSLSSGGAFSIRGVPPGAYSLSGTMDVVGTTGAPNDNDPTGSLPGTLTVVSSDPAPVALALTDPLLSAAFATSVPMGLAVFPMASGAFIEASGIFDSNGNEEAQSYTVDWSTSQTFATLAGSRSFLAGTQFGWFLNDPSLQNGTAYYFRVRGQAGSTFSAYATTPTPVMIGPATGANAVSGTVSFTGQATGPLYVGLASISNGNSNAYFTPYPAPQASPQAFTITGVPAGTYVLFALMDQNQNGVLDGGDLVTVLGASGQFTPTPVVVAGNLTGQALTMPAANASAQVRTQHSQFNGAGDDYQLFFSGSDLNRHLIASTITAGPNVIVPVDLPRSPGGSGFFLSVDNGSIPPTAGDTYTIQVQYGDGSSGTLNPQVTAVLDVALNPQPIGQTSNPTPTFSWTAPATITSQDVYFFTLNDNTQNSNVWNVPFFSNGLASTVTGLVWGQDPSATGAQTNPPTVGSLTTGDSYTWTLTLQDPNDNTAAQNTTFTP